MSADSEEIRTHIEETRAELAETVEALSAKADVTGRAKAKAADLSTQAKDKAGSLSAQAKGYGDSARTFAASEAQVAREEITRTQADKPWLLPSAGGVAVLGLLFWFFARRRNA